MVFIKAEISFEVRTNKSITVQLVREEHGANTIPLEEGSKLQQINNQLPSPSNGSKCDEHIIFKFITLAK